MTARILLILGIVFQLMSLDAQVICSIDNLTVEKLECNANGNFSVKINFVAINPGEQGFKIQGNGLNHGTFAYADLPVIIDGLPGNCTTSYEFVVKDIAKPDCFAVAELGKVCCQNDCGVEVINFKKTGCIENEIYKIGFDLLQEGTGNLGFDLFVNGTFKSFHKYADLPVQNIAIPASQRQVDTIVVCENDHPFCCDTVYILNPCECFVSNGREQIVECSNELEKYYLRFNFDHGQNSDSFLVAGPPPLSGKFAYTQLPLVLGPLPFSPAETNYLITDSENSSCFGQFNAPGVEECIACNLSEATYQIIPCNVSGKIYVKFRFKSTNPGVNGFTVRGNGQVYGDFQYGLEYYYLGPIMPDCLKKYEFVIVDNLYPQCKTNLAGDVKLCCTECEMGPLEVKANCNSNVSSISIGFASSGVPEDSVAVFINGVLTGKYKKGTEPLVVNYPFVEGKSYAVKVVALKKEGCGSGTEFTYQCANTGPCAFSGISLELSECSADQTFKVFLKFKAEGQHSDKFYVTINDKIFGPLLYGQAVYALGPIPKACHGIRVVIKDAVNEDCRNVIEKEFNKCCDGEFCEIGVLEIKPKCSAAAAGILLNFSTAGVPEDSVAVFINGVLTGKYKKGTGPLVVNYPFVEGKSYAVKVVALKKEGCGRGAEFTYHCANTGPCTFSAISLELSECSADQTFKVFLKFKAEGQHSEKFYVTINDKIFGPLLYGQTVYPLGPISKAYHGIRVVIKDAVNEDCLTVIEKEFNKCCEGEACEIGVLEIKSNCSAAAAGILLNFSTSGVPEDSVAVFINGVLTGKYKKGTSPLVVNYPFVEGKSYAVKVVALKKEGCGRGSEFTYHCTNTGPCAFSGISMELSECSADQTFKVFLKFKADGQHSDKFYVTINDKVFGPLLYGQAVYTLGPIPKACHGIRVVIKDALYEDCRTVIEKEFNKCCENGCEVSPVSLESICFEGKIIGLKAAVISNRPGQYKLYLDGTDLGIFTYGHIPVLVNIAPRLEGKANFKFIDLEENTCATAREYYLNCNNCQISALSADAVDCTETSFKFNIHFDAANTYSDSFAIFINGTRLGKYALIQLPILSPVYDPRADVTYQIRVIDAENEFCRAAMVVNSVDCVGASDEERYPIYKVFSNLREVIISTPNDGQESRVRIYALDGKLLTQSTLKSGTTQPVYQSQVSQLVVVHIQAYGYNKSHLIFIGN
ncbi:MAG: hypothetical protein IPN29_10450 [Saprospiraceae bacterium]|nr:hypothetical protein [Saprospiraceae bacterium]